MSIDVAAAAQLACLLEVSAPKPGNVSPGEHFADARYEHFLASAAAIGLPFADAGEQPLGVTIRKAVEATTRWTRSNTNLGMILLLAPLARAALLYRRPDLRGAVREVLNATTWEDARHTYAAIRLASPGGLGRVPAEDVSREPNVTLLEAMQLATNRDGIAREYVTAYETTFMSGVPAVRAARRAGLTWDDTVVETFLTVLAARPDTHIVRRGGEELARAVSQRAKEALRAGGIRSEEGRNAITEMDAFLRSDGNVANPGTSADLTAAALFVFLLNGGWRP
jgi:triphosphoribosyl-dephospho-CoA synthase